MELFQSWMQALLKLVLRLPGRVTGAAHEPETNHRAPVHDSSDGLTVNWDEGGADGITLVKGSTLLLQRMLAYASPQD